MEYSDFLATKRLVVSSSGREIQDGDINQLLFPFQRDLVRWAVRKGRAAIFAGTGLGKTFCQLEYARLIGKRSLILAPLAVARQTIREGLKLGTTVTYARSQEQSAPEGITITNYEMMEHFDPAYFDTVVLDESSILKNLTGKTRNALVATFKNTPNRLCCTATPAPNDILELSNHAAFLGIMTPAQMTSIFFVHEAGVFEGTSSRWRLKRHAVKDFYRWLSSWGIALEHPSDLDYEDDGYQLPELRVDLHTVESNYAPPGMLFLAGGISATEARQIRKGTTNERVQVCADLVNDNDEQWIIWAGLNTEADSLHSAIPDSVNVEGSMSPEAKADALERFVTGETRVLVSKTSIAGFGMNMQQCHNMIFCGIDYSWEAYYQAIRRIYRFGQKSPVKVIIVTTEQERTIFEVIQAKEREAIKMIGELISASKNFAEAELHKVEQKDWTYSTNQTEGKGWKLMLGDSAERMAEIANNSIHLSVYSPPFSDMYIYNATERDLSNSKDLDEFFAHYSFIIKENLRVTMPGRIACVHVQDPKAFFNRDGFRGLRDFPGMVIEAYRKEGWIFRSRITIDKNPQIVATRNKDTDLLFVTGKRDSADLAPMATDYVLVFKKPGDNPIPITPYVNKEMTENDWITWAHAVWYDIRETDVLNVSVAKANDDEKHMCPLQLPLIERCLKLWSNPGETVLSPFGGIGSEGYMAVKLGRKAVLIELKPEYYSVAARNLRNAESQSQALDLFTFAGISLDEDPDHEQS